MEMTLLPDSTHYGNDFVSDLTTLPGWKAADDTTRLRILAAAKRYLIEQDPETPKWFGTNTVRRPALAGYRALRLLWQEDPIFVSNIPADVWGKWSSIILAFPISHGKEEEVQQDLIKLAYQKAPDEIIQVLTWLIDKENRESDRIFIVRKLHLAWDDRLASVLLKKATESGLKPDCMGSLLDILLDHNVCQARTFAKSLIPLPPPPGGKERTRAVIVASALMTRCEDAGWPVVWPAMQRDTEFGREVVTRVAHELDRGKTGIWNKLTEEKLADLYIWLAHQFPHAEDPKYEEAHAVGPRENVAFWRDSLLRHLKERGTRQACEAIQRIANELPNFEWLTWVLLEVQEITRSRTWLPPRPADILKATSNQKARLVQSGEQLVGALVESLKSLEAKLQGETPAAIDLWNAFDKKYRPKDEPHFADYVKRHLDEDLKVKGIIVNREVEIRRGEDSSKGERTDVHVDAIMRGSRKGEYDCITAIIETKGCWNKELMNGMKTQLVDRYMKDSHCHYGLYLVGWFCCDQWDSSDYRKNQAPKINIREAQKVFDAASR